MAHEYSRSQLLSDINVGIFGKIGMLPNTEDFANNVVREVHNEVTIKSTKRTVALDPILSDAVVEYTCPVDLRDYKIIDINPALGDPRYFGAFNLIPVEEWSRFSRFGDVAIDETEGDKTLLIQTRNSSLTDGLSTLADVIVYISYYSKYPWQSSGGTLKQLSTDDSDLLVATESEYDLIVKKGIMKGRSLTRADRLDREEARKEYDEAVKAYTMTNIDESKVMVSTYHYQ